MAILKKRDIKKALKAGAKAGGVSLADVRADIEATIDEAMNGPDPEVQAWLLMMKSRYSSPVMTSILFFRVLTETLPE